MLAVAGHGVALRDEFQQGFVFFAQIDGKRAAGVESTTARRIYRAGNIAA